MTSGDFRDFFIEYFTVIYDPYGSQIDSSSNWENENENELTETTVIENDNDISTNFISVLQDSTDTGTNVVKYITEFLSAPSSPQNSKKNKNENYIRIKLEMKEKLDTILWDELYHQKGMPKEPEPSFQNSLADAAEILAKKWISYENSIIEKSGKSENSSVKVGVKEDVEVSLSPQFFICTHIGCLCQYHKTNYVVFSLFVTKVLKYFFSILHTDS